MRGITPMKQLTLRGISSKIIKLYPKGVFILNGIYSSNIRGLMRVLSCHIISSVCLDFISLYHNPRNALGPVRLFQYKDIILPV